MNDIEQDQLVRSLAPTHHVPVSTLSPTGPAAADLLHEILTSIPEANPVARPASGRWRLVIAMSTVAAATALVFGLAVLPPDRTWPVGPVPAQAQALAFTESGGFLEIRIKDPAADPQRYRREIADRGLDIQLKLAPARPDQIGRVVFIEESTPGIEPVEQPGHCDESGNCSVGVRVPVNYRGNGVIIFGREARPGEEVQGGTTDERALAKRVEGKTVSEMKRILAAAGKAPSYRTGPLPQGTPADQIPDTWIVIDATPVPGNVILVWVSADGKVPPRPSSEASPSPPG